MFSSHHYNTDSSGAGDEGDSSGAGDEGDSSETVVEKTYKKPGRFAYVPKWIQWIGMILVLAVVFYFGICVQEWLCQPH